MKKLINLILIAFVLMLSANTSFSQNAKQKEEMVKSELAKRGLTEEEVREALEEKGINIDDLENATPEQVLRIQEIIEQLEKEKKSNKDEETISVQVVKEEKPEDKDSKIEDIKEEISEEIKKEGVEQVIITDEKLSDKRIYGHRMFGVPTKPNKNLLNISGNYILGSGDKISVSIWSDISNFERNYTVDEEGYIKVKFGDINRRVNLGGITLNKARKKLNSIFSKFISYKPGEIDINLLSSRSINISIYGEVLSPGSFDVNSTNTIFEGMQYAGGVSDIASVRNIKLMQNKTGKVKIFDLYKFVSNPKYDGNLFLTDNDFIYVPVAQKLVSIEGAVKKPYTFELIDGENLSDLIKYAGGFKEDAIKDIIQVERYVGNKKVLIDINNNQQNSFSLNNGDIVKVRTISTNVDNDLFVLGEVLNPGRFEMKKGYRIYDAIKNAGLKPTSKTDFAFLTRKKDDGNIVYIKVNIDDILNNVNDEKINFLLQNNDKLTIYPKSRYADESNFSISGAVREPGEYKYGPDNSMNVLKAIELAGGLKRSASDIAIVHRKDPLNPYTKQYIRIDLQKIVDSSDSSENIYLEPFDKLEILSKSTFNEETTVRISGAVNNPGEFQYGEGMGLQDILVLAGGFKLSAATNNIEVSRVIIKNNEPTKVVVRKIEVDRDIDLSSDDFSSFALEPYDHVYVRNVPEFEMQKIITIRGEVKYPGEYPLTIKNERVADIIKRSGGFSEEAFLEGATLYRSKDNVGYIVMDLKKAMKYSKSKHNYILKNGDVLFIPKNKDFVTIKGATNVDERYKDEIAFNKNGINVPYHKGKRAMYYINKYAGGISDVGSKKEILVEYPTGEIAKTFDYGLFKRSPKVMSGSIIKVGYKKKKKDDKDKENKEVDWNKIISDSVAQISTIMTLVILFKSLSQ